jgi:hypothetical protein
MDDLAMLSYKQFIHFLLVNSLRNIRSAHYFLIFKLSKDFLFSLGLGLVQSDYYNIHQIFKLKDRIQIDLLEKEIMRLYF